MAVQMETDEIVWEDPPRSFVKGRFWRTLQPFLENQGRWGRLPMKYETQGAASGAKHRLITRRTSIPDPEGDWYFEVREVDDVWYLWARYGEPEEEVVAATNGGRKKGRK